MSTQTSGTTQSFQDRLQRIQASHGAPEEPVPTSKPTKALKAPRALTGERRKIPMGAVMTAALGVAIVLFCNVLAFQYRFGGGYFADVFSKIGPLPVMALMLFVLMIGLGLRDKPHVIGFALAMPAMYFGEPYLAWFATDLWMDLYSPEHIDNMLIRAGLRAPILAS
ncbi:MAG: hypothetical protein AB8B51_14880 [Sedimentitalea sp.]